MTAARGWTGRKKTAALAGAVMLVGYFLYQPAQQMGHLDTNPLEVYKLDRSDELVFDPRSGSTERSQRLQVGYWDERDEGRRLYSARTLMPHFITTATSLGLSTILMMPSQPLLARRFPIVTTSQHIKFDKDSMLGAWVEEYRKGDSAKAVGGSPLATDDSVARLFLKKVCAADSTGYAMLASSSRADFGPWSALDPLRTALPSDCGVDTKLLTIAHVSDTGRVRRLGYALVSRADSAFAAVWLTDDADRRAVTTLQTERRQ